MDGQHGPLERRRGNGPRLDLQRGHPDLPGRAPAARGQADCRRGSNQVGAGDHEVQQPAPGFPAGRHVGGHRRRPHRREADPRAHREVWPRHVRGSDGALLGLRRAGLAPSARRPPKGTLHLGGGAGQRRRLSSDGRDHRRRVHRRPPREPGPGRRSEQRLPGRLDDLCADDLQEHHRCARRRERRNLPPADAPDSVGLRLRCAAARGVRRLLRGDDSSL